MKQEEKKPEYDPSNFMELDDGTIRLQKMEYANMLQHIHNLQWSTEQLKQWRSQDQSSIEKKDHEITQLKAKLEATERALQIESAEPSERSQEANHYNWLDEQNEQLKSKLEKACEALRFYAERYHWGNGCAAIDPCDTYTCDLGVLRGGLKARQALEAYRAANKA